MTKVLNAGFVEMVDAMGGDYAVLDAARVLQEKETLLTMRDSLKPRDVDLIDAMIEGRHGTPFEHVVFKFRVKLPVFVAREWHRHRISSYNEISMRWMKGKPDFYVPTNMRSVTDGAKKIDYSYQPLDEDTAAAFCGRLSEWHDWSYSLYERALEDGVAPEQARYFLPNTFFTQMIWTVNARSLMNFLSLRNEAHAMWEIRQYAVAIEVMFASIMPATYKAWTANDRRVP